MSATRNVPRKKDSWENDYAVERFHSKIDLLLLDEHLKFNKIYGETQISRMDDSSIEMLLSKREKYHGVCADMARLSVYHINTDESSEYIAYLASFGDNKDVFPENTLFGLINPHKLTVSNNHTFVIAFSKDNLPIKNKITWAEAVKYNAILVDPWFKITFKISDPNALQYVYYSIRTVYSLTAKKAKKIAEDAIKNLDETPDAALDYSKLLEIDLEEVSLSKVKKFKSNKERTELNLPLDKKIGFFVKEKENTATMLDTEQQFDDLDLDIGLCCIQ